MSWRIQLGPKSNDQCPCERKAEGGDDTEKTTDEETTQGRRTSGGGGGGWRDAATSLGPLEPPEPGRGKGQFLLELLEGVRPCTHLDFGLLASVREHISAVLSSPGCSNLFKQPQGPSRSGRGRCLIPRHSVLGFCQDGELM